MMKDLSNSNSDQFVRFLDLLIHKVGMNSIKRVFIARNENPRLSTFTIDRTSFPADVKLADEFWSVSQLNMNSVTQFHNFRIPFCDSAESANYKSVILAVIAPELI